MSCIRGDDSAAFEALYERHQRELLSFCLYMLGSRADAEEALQVTFASAYRALLADERPVALRPWLFTIARNQCLSILRRRRPTVELEGEATVSGEPAASGDLFRELELREEVRHTLAGVRGLPEGQRAAMVLAELHGLSQSEIGSVLGLRPEQVKALVYQARSSLISERSARDADCREIREELDSARGAALLKGQLRKHVRACPDCRTYADGMSRRRRGFGAFLPLAPWLALKLRALQDALSSAGTEQLTYAGGTTLGGTVAGAALVAGGPIKAIAVKVAAGAALLGLSTGLGAPVLSTPSVQHRAGFAAGLVAKSAWLPLLGEGEGEGGGSGNHGALTGRGFGGGGSGGVPAGGPPTGGAGVPPLGGIEGTAGGGGGYGGGGGAGSSGSADGSGQHGDDSSSGHHVAGGSGGAAAGAGAGAAGTTAEHQHGTGQHRGQSGGSGGSGASGASGGSGGSSEPGQSGEPGHAGGSGQTKGGSSPGKERQPHGGGGGGQSGESGHAGATQKPSQKEREQSRAEERRTRLEERKAREKEHKATGREHKREQKAREHEKAQRENERARTVAQHQKEREQSKKQAQSRKQRELKQREREKNKRIKGRALRNRSQEAEAAT